MEAWAMQEKNRVMDQTLAQQVSQQLRTRGLQIGTHISIMVQDGAVMLSGEIDAEKQRHTAVQAARSIHGVRTVVDRLHMKS
jgi:osmotically-inducible protein OsmY